MIFLDTDIFVLDRFFRKDARYPINTQFLEELKDEKRSTTIYNLLEFLGLASFNLSEIELNKMFVGFGSLYSVAIAYPHMAVVSPQEFLERQIEQTLAKIRLKMNFSDALILQTVEQGNPIAFITWNKKHFKGRTTIPIYTPEEFLEQR
ncbi:MAG: hypothetical protein ACXADX_12550 [Candidatus Hodarchaeales archaeon]|jgi:predicted nucleic acid-binding protein